MTNDRDNATQVTTIAPKAIPLDLNLNCIVTQDKPLSTEGASARAPPARKDLVTWLPAQTIAKIFNNLCAAAGYPIPPGVGAT